MNHTFNKEQGIWYIDLPAFLEAGLGNKGNLMMVAGADTFLDILSDSGETVTVQIELEAFDGQEAKLEKQSIGMDKELLDSIGHPEVDYGAYYTVTEFKGQPFAHELWLCPVTEYVFDGGYPEKIFIQVLP